MNITIIKIVLTLLNSAIIFSDYTSYLDSKGYEKVKKNNLVSKNLLNLIGVLGISIIPGINTLIAYLSIFESKKICELFFHRDLEDGTIRRKSDVIDLTKTKDLTLKDVVKDETSQYEYVVEKEYDEMTTAEKLAFLEKERRKLVGENDNVVEKSFEKKLER